MRESKESKAIIGFLQTLKHGEWTGKDNFDYHKIPVTVFSMEQEGADEFNRIYQWGLKECANIVNWTPSGGISKTGLIPRICNTRVLNTCVEMTIILRVGVWRIQFVSRGDYYEDGARTKFVPGTRSFRTFKAECKKKGINLDEYAIENGEAVKATIESPLIKCADESYLDQVFEGVHHVDFHNSYPAGLCNCYPEFKPIIQRWFEKRKANPEYKQMLNSIVGYMQSLGCCQARWAHLSKAAIGDNNKRVRELASRIESNGGKVILYNTDGFWYQGDVFHGEGEGHNLGEWENDHVDCKIRVKSDGVYEYEEAGVYHPVIRGRTWLDRYLDRSQWHWGDIYNPDAEHIIEWLFEEGIGVYEQTDNVQGH